MAYISYKQKLLDPRWQKKRLEILQRDDFKCKACDDKKSTLHVHHLKYAYVRNPWEYDNEFLITLCDECHSEWHRLFDGEHNQIRVCFVAKLYHDIEGERIMKWIREQEQTSDE